MGAEPATMSGLAGMGDLIATCISPLSRNRQVGERLGKGESIDEILGSMNMVAEGVKTARTVMELAGRYGVELPICAEIRRVVSGEISAIEAYRGLMKRSPAGHEADPV
jgi:glycerol-3-phosphate dehydrogenase (NAD(P)+)